MGSLISENPASGGADVPGFGMSAMSRARRPPTTQPRSWTHRHETREKFSAGCEFWFKLEAASPLTPCPSPARGGGENNYDDRDERKPSLWSEAVAGGEPKLLGGADVPGFGMSAMSRARPAHTYTRRHQETTSAPPPCEPPTAQKPCRGYPVVVGQESGHSQTSKSDVCAPAPRRITTHIQTQVVITLVCLAG